MADNTPSVITTLEEFSALLVNVNKNNPGLIPQRHTWDTGHLCGLFYSLAILILKILGTTAFPHQPLPLRWQQRIQILPNLPCLPFPTPAKQSDSAPQAHSPPLNGKSLCPTRSPQRNVTAVTGTNLDTRKPRKVGGPAKMLSRLIKRDKKGWLI